MTLQRAPLLKNLMPEVPATQYGTQFLGPWQGVFRAIFAGIRPTRRLPERSTERPRSPDQAVAPKTVRHGIPKGAGSWPALRSPPAHPPGIAAHWAAVA